MMEGFHIQVTGLALRCQGISTEPACEMRTTEGGKGLQASVQPCHKRQGRGYHGANLSRVLIKRLAFL